MEPKFKIGDVVVLNSGGPYMTVTEAAVKNHTGGDGLWWCNCRWFVEGMVQIVMFPEKALKRADV